MGNLFGCSSGEDRNTEIGGFKGRIIISKIIAEANSLHNETTLTIPLISTDKYLELDLYTNTTTIVTDCYLTVKVGSKTIVNKLAANNKRNHFDLPAINDGDVLTILLSLKIHGNHAPYSVEAQNIVIG